MTTLIPIHSAAMCQVDHVRCAMVVGARSLFHSGECETSSRSSTKSRRSASLDCCSCPVVMKCRVEPQRHREHRGRQGESDRCSVLPLCLSLCSLCLCGSTSFFYAVAHSPRLRNLPSPARPLYSLFSTMTLPRLSTVSGLPLMRMPSNRL